MGMQKGIYVKDADLGLWDRAVAYAESQRITMSALIMNALERYLAEVEQTGEQ